MTDRRLLNSDYAKPPVVDFSKPVGPIAVIQAQRARLASMLGEMDVGLRDARRYSAEGRWNAECAIVWAVGLLIADGVKEGLSAMDRRAAVLFRAQDRAIAKAEKIMKMLGGSGLVQREDVLKNVDASLQPAARLVGEVRSAQALLKKHGVDAPPQTKTLLNIGLVITGDAILILDGFKERDRALKRGDAQEAQIRHRIDGLRQRMRQLDLEFSRLVLQGEILSRTV